MNTIDYYKDQINYNKTLLIGYTTSLSDNSVVEVEIIGDYEIYGYVYKQPTNNAIYKTQKYSILNVAYDVYGNKIDIKNNIIFEYEQKLISFCFNLDTELERLREKLFFNKIEGIYGMDTDSEDECRYPHVNGYEIYVKKDDIDINFSGMQYVYDNLGYIVIEFYHNNGIKEGVYKLSNRCIDYDTEITFCNDVEIDFVKKRKNVK
jgi:hypothetical protein